MIPTRSWPGVSSLRAAPQLQASETQSKSTVWIHPLRSMVRPGMYSLLRADRPVSFEPPLVFSASVGPPLSRRAEDGAVPVKRKLERAVRGALAETVDEPAEIEIELAILMALLSL